MAQAAGDVLCRGRNKIRRFYFEGGKNLKRFLSGLFLIPLTVAVTLYTSSFWLTSAVSLVTLLSLKEFSEMTSEKGGRGWNLPAIFLGGGLPYIFYINRPELVPLYLVLSVFIFFASAIFSKGASFKDSIERISYGVLGIVYIALPMAHFIPLSGLAGGRRWVLFLFAVVWLNDTAAYYTGRLIGAHKLSPAISPGKTVEGAIGGGAGGLVTAYLFNYFFGMRLTHPEVIFIAVFLGAVSILGDLCESLVKRSAGVKDSGSIIPGHGGMLDRIDSIIFSVPALYYYLLWRTLLF